MFFGVFFKFRNLNFIHLFHQVFFDSQIKKTMKPILAGCRQTFFHLLFTRFLCRSCTAMIILLIIGLESTSHILGRHVLTDGLVPFALEPAFQDGLVDDPVRTRGTVSHFDDTSPKWQPSSCTNLLCYLRCSLSVVSTGATLWTFPTTTIGLEAADPSPIIVHPA